MATSSTVAPTETTTIKAPPATLPSTTVGQPVKVGATNKQTKAPHMTASSTTKVFKFSTISPPTFPPGPTLTPTRGPWTYPGYEGVSGKSNEGRAGRPKRNRKVMEKKGGKQVTPLPERRANLVQDRLQGVRPVSMQELLAAVRGTVRQQLGSFERNMVKSAQKIRALRGKIDQQKSRAAKPVKAAEPAKATEESAQEVRSIVPKPAAGR